MFVTLKRKERRGVEKWKKERKNKSLDSLVCHIWILLPNWDGSRKSLFLFSEQGSFTYKDPSDVNAYASPDAVSLCIQTTKGKY